MSGRSMGAHRELVKSFISSKGKEKLTNVRDRIFKSKQQGKRVQSFCAVSHFST